MNKTPPSITGLPLLVAIALGGYALQAPAATVQETFTSNTQTGTTGAIGNPFLPSSSIQPAPEPPSAPAPKPEPKPIPPEEGVDPDPDRDGDQDDDRDTDSDADGDVSTDTDSGATCR